MPADPLTPLSKEELDALEKRADYSPLLIIHHETALRLVAQARRGATDVLELQRAYHYQEATVADARGQMTRADWHDGMGKTYQAVIDDLTKAREEHSTR